MQSSTVLKAIRVLRVPKKRLPAFWSSRSLSASVTPDSHASAVDKWFTDQLLRKRAEDLRFVRTASEAAGLPSIEVSPLQGAMLQVLAMAINARHVLEIGTLGGYSSIWLAAAATNVVSLEVDPARAAFARRNATQAGVGDRVDVRTGRGADLLPSLHAEIAAGTRPAFDMVFIDADKPSNPVYLEWSLRMTRPGSLIIADNVVRRGAAVPGLAGPVSEQEAANLTGVREFVRIAGSSPKLRCTAVQTVGSKGWDGFALCVVLP